MQQSSTPEKRKGKLFHEWKCPRGLLAWLWSGWIDCVVVQHFSRAYWLFSFSSFVNFPYMCLFTFAYKLKILTRLLWEHFQILIFWVVLHAPSLSFYSCIIMCSCINRLLCSSLYSRSHSKVQFPQLGFNVTMKVHIAM